MGIGIFSRARWPEVQLEQIRTHARILAIDDQPFAYEPLFKRDGYSIEVWHDIKDLSRLERGEFDLILLDLQGVAAEESPDQGLGLLKHIKSVNPAQIVVAYSNADWPVKFQPFFRMADATLPKGGDYIEFKRAVDELIKQRYSLSFYLTKMAELGISKLGDVAALRKHAEKAILSSNSSGLLKYLGKHLDDPDLVRRIVAIASTGTAVLKLFRAFAGE